MTIRIVCDSTADLPGHLVEEYGIHIVPLKVHFGEEEYRDGVDITAGEFYQKLQTSPVLPTTSQPSPGEFVEVYRNLLEQGVDTIISIHISAQLSGTITRQRWPKLCCRKLTLRLSIPGRLQRFSVSLS